MKLLATLLALIGIFDVHAQGIFWSVDHSAGNTITTVANEWRAQRGDRCDSGFGHLILHLKFHLRGIEMAVAMH